MEKVYYTISEVCEMLDIKPHTIRYWETEFSQLKSKTKKGYSRRYTSKEIDFLKLIKELIYDRKFTLEGALAEVKKINDKKKTESKLDLKFLKQELIEIKNLLLQRKYMEN